MTNEQKTMLDNKVSAIKNAPSRGLQFYYAGSLVGTLDMMNAPWEELKPYYDIIREIKFWED